MARGKVSLKEALVVSRPFWWLTTSVPFIVGALLADDKFSIMLFIGAIYFLIPYNLLLYGVNDIFDYETDIRNERKTGAPHGSVLSRVKHPSLWRWIVAANAPFLLYFMAVGNIESMVFLIMMIYLALAYSVNGLRYKEIPFIDALTSGFHYASPFLFALFLFESPNLWTPAFAGFYFWAVGNHAFGAIQDIVPDREARLKSIATVLGAGKTMVFCFCAYVLAVIAPVLGYGVYGFAAAAAIAPYFLVILTTFRFRKDARSIRFKQAWRKFVTLNYIVGGTCSLILIYLYNK